MEMFDVHRRDLFDFDEYMNLKNPGFGGPKSAIMDRDENGKRIKKSGEIKLEGYRNIVERHPAFKHEVWNSTYKAMGSDLVHKQDVGKNPYDYADPYENMGIPVVDVTKGRDSRKTNESSILTFEDYMSLNEQQVAPARPREREVEIERPGRDVKPNKPNRPPRRRVEEAPKNYTENDAELVDELAASLGISKEEAQWLLSDDNLPATQGDNEMLDKMDLGNGDVDYSYEEDYDEDDYEYGDEDDYSMGAMGESGCGCNP